MVKHKTLLITGAAGFIGSCMASFLHRQGHYRLLLCDDFSIERKKKNYEHIAGTEKIERDVLEHYLTTTDSIDFVIHLGARTDTTEMDYRVLEKLNLHYSQMIWRYCSEHAVPLIYASSAATYGHGEFGYDDNESRISDLQPLNPYGVSKNEFDKWALSQQHQGFYPPHWYGLKFFNVYGPNEYHKGRMASVIFHAFQQIHANGKMKLFRSHRPDYSDGGQKRDFIYVKDLLKIIGWLLNKHAPNGIYNLGSGCARTFVDLAEATFSAMHSLPSIEFIDTPIDIRDTYQYFTEANLQKLRQAGYTDPFYSLEAGIKDYVQHYLQQGKYF